MDKFPIWTKPTRTCCKFHANEPLRGGDCHEPEFGYVLSPGHYYVFKLDWQNMKADYVRRGLHEEQPAATDKMICCEYDGEFLQAKGPYRFEDSSV